MSRLEALKREWARIGLTGIPAAPRTRRVLKGVIEGAYERIVSAADLLATGREEDAIRALRGAEAWIHDNLIGLSTEGHK